MKNFFTKRSILGTILFMTMVGETAVPQLNGLYTPAGFIGLFLLYFVLFHLFESLIVRYHLATWQVFLLNFVIYSVVVTGFLHREITEYVIQKDYLFTSMIRLQSSMYVFWALFLLNKIVPRTESRVLSVKTSAIMALLFVSLLSVTPVFGFRMIAFTLQTAPLYSIFYLVLAIVALILIRKDKGILGQPYQSKFVWVSSILLLILGLIPSLVSFIALLIMMPVVSIYLLTKKEFRQSPI